MFINSYESLGNQIFIVSWVSVLQKQMKLKYLPTVFHQVILFTTIYLNCMYIGVVHQSSGMHWHCWSVFVDMCKAAAAALLIGSKKRHVVETLVGGHNIYHSI